MVAVVINPIVGTTGRKLNTSLIYDRRSGRLYGASLAERASAAVLQVGSAVTRSLDHRGFRLGCNLVSAMLPARDILVRLDADAVFCIPFADGYWSTLLDDHFRYEAEIEIFLKSAADLKYTLVDCGANFGYWSVLSLQLCLWRTSVIAIEASPENALRLRSTLS